MMHPTWESFLGVDHQNPVIIRQEFGVMLQNWRLRCGWTQYTYCDWAKQSGNTSSAISYGNLSVIEQGKAGELRQKVFWQLWEMNRRIAHRDWGDLLLIKDPLLRARLDTAVSLGDDDCPLWGPAEFWSCYNGLLPVPLTYRDPPSARYTAKQAVAINRKLRQLFNSLVLTFQSPLDAVCWLRDRIPSERQDRFFQMAIGGLDYSADELSALSNGEQLLAMQWLEHSPLPTLTSSPA